MFESLLRGEPGLAPFKCIPDRLQKHISLERLRQELDGTCFHGLHRHGYVAVARYEYDRHSGVLNGYPRL